MFFFSPFEIKNQAHSSLEYQMIRRKVFKEELQNLFIFSTPAKFHFLIFLLHDFFSSVKK
jgi:hypothetical protein